jgi:hypothetical protein
VGTEIFFGKSEIRLDTPVNKLPVGQISRPSGSTHGAEIPGFLFALQAALKVTALFRLADHVEQRPLSEPKLNERAAWSRR